MPYLLPHSFQQLIVPAGSHSFDSQALETAYAAAPLLTEPRLQHSFVWLLYIYLSRPPTWDRRSYPSIPVQSGREAQEIQSQETKREYQVESRSPPYQHHHNACRSSLVGSLLVAGLCDASSGLPRLQAGMVRHLPRRCRSYAQQEEMEHHHRVRVSLFVSLSLVLSFSLSCPFLASLHPSSASFVENCRVKTMNAFAD